MNKPTAVFPGSFDPFTRAHLELVRNAGKFFDITILICQNSSKAGGMFTPQQRKEIIERCISDDEKAHVKVEIHEGLVSDYCAANDIKYIIRGIQYKNAAEEIDLAHIWYQDENIKTVFFRRTKHSQKYSSCYFHYVHHLICSSDFFGTTTAHPSPSHV